MLNCDFQDTGSVYGFDNVGSFGVKEDNHEIYENIHVYFNDPVTGKREAEAKYTSAAFKEGIDYMVYGLLGFSYRYSNTSSFGYLNQILFKTTSVLLNSITRVTLDCPIYESEKYTVKRVDTTNELFKNKTNLRFVALSDAIVGMGIYAFYGCTNLERVEFGDNIEYILSNAFQNCTKLRMVNFGSGNKLRQINDNVFAGCTSLSYVDFNGNTADWVVNETITITADQLFDPYDAAIVVKQYAQYQWLR